MSSSSALRLTLSTASALPRGAGAYAGLAERAGMAGIDLDATTWVGRRLPGLRADSKLALPVPIASVWLAASDLVGFGREPGAREIGDRTRHHSSVELVVRLADSTGSANDQHAVQQAYELFRTTPWARHLTLAIQAIATEGGRTHLARLRGLRRLAEEWGAGLALDIGPRSDARWEAEAAVQILGERLALLRLRTALLDTGRLESEIARRTLRAAFETGFRGPISVVPATPLWRAWRSAALEEDLAAGIDVIERLFRERPTRSTPARRTPSRWI